jgi:hypothetical protein
MKASEKIDFLPKNMSLPFFSYGIFRPGEIAYSIIEEFVDESKIEKKTIIGELKVRDGLLVYDIKSNSKVDGYLLYFNKGDEEKAYRKIEMIEPKEYYTWNSDNKTFKDQFNILYAKSVEKGIDEKKSNFDPSVFDSLFSSIWNDPFFSKGKKILHKFNKNDFINDLLTEKEYPNWEEEYAFNKYIQIQVQYTLLWSLIERFTFLLYGLGANPTKRNKNFGNDEDLKICIEQMLLDTNFSYLIKDKGIERIIFKSDKPSSSIKMVIKSDEEIDAPQLIDFYYSLRSNIIHRGKSGINNLELLQQSFNELLFIFENIWEIKKNKAFETKHRIDTLINQNEKNNRT